MAAKEEADTNKVVLVGDFGVGKTTIFTRFKTGRSEGGSLNTRKECECSKSLVVDGKETKVRSRSSKSCHNYSCAGYKA